MRFARANDEVSLLPVDIVSAQRDDFMGAEPEPSEEREDGPIAQRRGRGTRRESENLRHLVSR
jgi:hypothetical protein